MSEFEDLRRTVETNFRLNALHTRELGSRVHAEMASLGHRLTEVTHGLNEVTDRLSDVSRSLAVVSNKTEKLGETFQGGMEQVLERDQETLSAITKVLDNSIDMHKTLTDHERRIRLLEDRAS